MKKNMFRDFISYVKSQPQVMYERSIEVAPYLEFVYITEGHFVLQVSPQVYDAFIVDDVVFLPLQAGGAKVYRKKDGQLVDGTPGGIANVISRMSDAIHDGKALIDTGIELRAGSGNVAVLKHNGKKCHIAVNADVYHRVVDNFPEHMVYGSGSRSVVHIADMNDYNIEFFLLPTNIDVDAKLNDAFKYYEEVEF